jgi:hypothetical protein
VSSCELISHPVLPPSVVVVQATTISSSPSAPRLGRDTWTTLCSAASPALSPPVTNQGLPSPLPSSSLAALQRRWLRESIHRHPSSIRGKTSSISQRQGQRAPWWSLGGAPEARQGRADASPSRPAPPRGRQSREAEVRAGAVRRRTSRRGRRSGGPT